MHEYITLAACHLYIYNDTNYKKIYVISKIYISNIRVQQILVLFQ